MVAATCAPLDLRHPRHATDVVRRDRILGEAFAAGGDLRQLADLLGIHVATAGRYADIAQSAATAEHAGA